MPSYDPSFNNTFREIAEKRVGELIATGKKINVMWSGGLDSTTLVALFYPYAKNVKVHMTYNSIIESGYVYDTLIKNNFENTVHTSAAFNEWREDELFITGDPGNHLHTIPSINSYQHFVPGIDDLFAKENIHLINKPYQDYIPEAKQEFYAPAIARSPRPIETLEDFIWFNTFNFRWDESQFALALKLMQRWRLQDKNYNKVINSVIGFYYTPDFQQWSIHRKEPQYELSDFKKTIKLEMRNVMRYYFGNFIEDYVQGKGIQESPVGLYAPNYVLLTDNMEIVYDN